MFGGSQTDFDTEDIVFSVSGGANTFVGGISTSVVCFGAWSAFLFCFRPFHLQIFSNCEKIMKFTLGKIHFSVIHEVYDGEQVNELHIFEIKELVVMAVPF